VCLDVGAAPVAGHPGGVDATCSRTEPRSSHFVTRSSGVHHTVFWCGDISRWCVTSQIQARQRSVSGACGSAPAYALALSVWREFARCWYHAQPGYLPVSNSAFEIIRIILPPPRTILGGQLHRASEMAAPDPASRAPK
jgi:hypothetical protein